MGLKLIATDRAPAAIGPYSQAVISGGFLFTSGQIPMEPSTGQLAGESIEVQTRKVLDNLGAILQAGGVSYRDVIKTTLFIKNMNDFPVINKIYAEYFLEPFPARSTVEVARLPKDVLIEIEAVAKV